MHRLNDLRFVIGLFFTMTGSILLALGLWMQVSAKYAEHLNSYSGLTMLAFGLFMIWLSTKKNFNT